MVWRLALIVIVGVLVALMLESDVRSASPDCFFAKSMSLVLTLKNKGEREKSVSETLGLLVLKKFPLSKESAKFQES